MSVNTPNEKWFVEAQARDDSWWSVSSLGWPTLSSRSQALGAALSWTSRYLCVVRIRHEPSGTVEVVAE